MAEYPSILSIDFSKARTGCAFGKPPGLPKLFHKEFGEASNLTDCAASMLDWVPEILAVYQPDVVLLEAALPPIASRDQNSARLALGADFLIKGFCARNAIKLIEVDGGTWKSRILGTSRLKTPEVKKRSMALCKAFDLDPRNHDEADAFAVWLYGVIEKTQFPSNKILEIIARQSFRLVA